jgi:septum formation protein
LIDVNPESDSISPENVTVYLASASPRRQELLRQAGIAHAVILPDIEEVVRPGESAEDFVMRMALDKARAGQARMISEGRLPAPVLSADTCIVVENEIIGKSLNRADGISILKRLAGQSHEVLTGVALIKDNDIQQVLSRSQVVFGPLSDKEIEAYWESGEPVDKAGAYAIQGRAAAFIERIEGSYSGIVGLPLFDVVNMIKKTGARL